MRLARARIADQQHILTLGDELADQKFAYQRLVNIRLGVKLETLDRLERRELRGLDPTLHRPLLSLGQLTLAQPKQEYFERDVLPAADRRHGGVVSMDRWEFELLEAVLQQDRRLPFRHGPPPEAYGSPAGWDGPPSRRPDALCRRD